MNRNEKYFFIVNHSAGTGRKKDIWKRVLKPELIRRGIHFQAFTCDRPGHAKELASQIMQEHNGTVTIVVVGGDGTFNETLNGITDFSRVRLGFIPAGSANDLGYALGISTNPVQALTSMLEGRKILQMDLGKTTIHADGSVHYFAISSGIGLDAQVCSNSRGGALKAALNRMHLGKLIYFINAVRIVFSQPLTTAKLIFTDSSGEEHAQILHSLYFFAGMNQPNEGGHLIMARDADPDDGALSFSMASGLTRPQALISLGMLALRLHYRIPGYQVVNARTCHVMLKEPLEVHTDGETFGPQWDVTIECLPRQLTMIV
jgi:YegS/Rv2252/BmrU family lipid kinase